MSDRNLVVIDARLVRDPELRYTPSGVAVCNFSIAVNQYQKNKDYYTSYFDCVAWDKTAEGIISGFKKGNRIKIDGKLYQRRWNFEDKKHSRVEIIVDKYYFVDKKDGGVQQAFSGEESQEPNPFNDNDIPF